MAGFLTKEEAIADALRDSLGDDDAMEGFTIKTCVCGRTDHDENPQTMRDCERCEVLVISPGGTA